MRLPPVLLAALLLLAGVSCRTERRATDSAPVEGYEVLSSWPHDPQAFTQGLVYHQGHLYEGTGLNGQSSLREVELETGRVLRRVNLESQYFGEGLALHGDKLYQLTWRSNVGFIYDVKTFTPVGRFSYDTEGWGLTSDGTSLILSDGTSVLRFLDPTTFKVQRTLKVTDAGREVSRLNELEYIHGEIYANQWGSDFIARIDPATGHLKAWIDLSGLLPPAQRTGNEDVLNGIAYDEANNRLLVTGKNWSRLFALRAVSR
ncbi:glutaminyl-peptide cyclotransferase [Archangium primigenium]|uniref:glutaminyl-peptide cyclotransferase n=1 Tax=[Archangium] primigenium TaxID=2792470 RepID=UPI00195B4462|nr:glutaminyl-peptide cyclotransferase [Archangium primigenium]MBM7114166.1 glutaminyl-peptide cyclotransferase [Archangium primigenium]